MDSNKIIPLFIALLLIGAATAAANLISARRKKKIAGYAFKKNAAYARRRLQFFASAWASSSDVLPPLKALQMLAEALFFPDYKAISRREINPEALPVFREEIQQLREEYPASHNAGALDSLRELFPKIPAHDMKKTAQKIAAAGDAFMHLCDLDEQALAVTEKFFQSVDEEEKKKLEADFRDLHEKTTGKDNERYVKAAAAARRALLKLGEAAGEGSATPAHEGSGDSDPTQVDLKASLPVTALHILSTPFRFLARAWGRLGFVFLDSGCLLFTLIAALPLAVLICLLLAGMIAGPTFLYGAWSSGDYLGAAKWLFLWLLCLIGGPGVLAGVGSAYRDEPSGISPRRTGLRWVLICAAVGIILIPVFAQSWPGLLGRGGAVVAQQQMEAESAPAAKKTPPAAPQAKNLLKNGDFERLSGNRLVGWETDFYGEDEGSVRFSVGTGGAFSGNHYVTIENLEANDGKFVQRVNVKPETMYKLSCKIKVHQVGSRGKGGNISVLNISDTSRQLKDTGGKWVEVELCGRTGPNQKKLDVTARLGGYGGISKGKVSFDDFRLEEVDGLPQGAKTVKLYRFGSFTRPPSGMAPIRTFIYASLPLFLLLCISIKDAYYLGLMQQYIYQVP